MHIDEGGIQALLHGELAPDESSRLEAHLRGCRECAARAEEARAEEAAVFGALALLDVPPPPLSADDLRARAAGAVGHGEPGPGEARAPRSAEAVDRATERAGPGRWAGWRVAAGVALAFVLAGSLYAFPGSPVRDAIDRLLRRADPAPVVPSVVTDPSGVAVRAGEDFTVTFEAVGEGDTLRVRVVDAELVSLRADRRATFRSASAGLSVSGDSGNVYRLDVPRSAPLVRVRAGGRVVAEFRSGVLSADVSGAVPPRGPVLEVRP